MLDARTSHVEAPACHFLRLQIPQGCSTCHSSAATIFHRVGDPVAPRKASGILGGSWVERVRESYRAEVVQLRVSAEMRLGWPSKVLERRRKRAREARWVVRHEALSLLSAVGVAAQLCRCITAVKYPSTESICSARAHVRARRFHRTARGRRRPRWPCFGGVSSPGGSRVLGGVRLEGKKVKKSRLEVGDRARVRVRVRDPSVRDSG